MLRRSLDPRTQHVDPVRGTGLRVVAAALTGPSALAPVALAAGAVGALAVGRLAIRKAVVNELRATTVDIDTLTIRRLEVGGIPWQPRPAGEAPTVA